MKKIKILQEIYLKGIRHNYGTVFNYSTKFLSWIRKNKINHSVTEDL